MEGSRAEIEQELGELLEPPQLPLQLCVPLLGSVPSLCLTSLVSPVHVRRSRPQRPTGRTPRASRTSAFRWERRTFPTLVRASTDASSGACVALVGRRLTPSPCSHAAYSFDDVSGDASLNNFNINRAPSYLWSVLADIRSINSGIRIHVIPWSPVRRRRLRACIVISCMGLTDERCTCY